jgi:hypothetical protein
MKQTLRLARIASVIALGLCLPAPRASAQTSDSLEIGAQIPVEHIGELDATDAGIGVRVAWSGITGIGLEGELSLYPRDIPGETRISGSRTEGLFGMTAGPRLGQWRPFARLRSGFVHVGEAPAPVICPAIFPPIVTCRLASGATLFALDFGGGAEVSTSGRTFVRVDVGDRMVRYPGPAIDRDADVHEDDFFGHDVRLAFGAGWRF